MPKLQLSERLIRTFNNHRDNFDHFGFPTLDSLEQAYFNDKDNTRRVLNHEFGFTPDDIKEVPTEEDRRVQSEQTKRKADQEEKKRKDFETLSQRNVKEFENKPLLPRLETIPRDRKPLAGVGQDHPEFVPTQPNYVMQAHKEGLEDLINEGNKPYEQNPEKVFVPNPKASELLKRFKDKVIKPTLHENEKIKEAYERLNERDLGRLYEQKLKKLHQKYSKKETGEKKDKRLKGAQEYVRGLGDEVFKNFEEATREQLKSDESRIRSQFPQQRSGIPYAADAVVRDHRRRVLQDMNHKIAELKLGLGREGYAATERRLAAKEKGFGDRYAMKKAERSFEMDQLDERRKLRDEELRLQQGIYEGTQADLLKRQQEKQAIQDLAAQSWKERDEHALKNIERLLMALQGTTHVSHHGTAGDRPYDASRNASYTSPSSIFGHVATGLGSYGLQKAMKKTGGSLKRMSFAEGGHPLFQDALQNAVKNKMDPLRSLQNVENYDLMVNLLKQKQDQGRLKRAQGGSVSPIVKGAQEAKDYAFRNRLEQYAEELERPEPENLAKEALDAIAAALATLPKDNYGKRFGAAYQAGSKTYQDKKDKEKSSRHLAQQVRFKLAENLQKEKEHEQELAFKREQLAEQAAYHQGHLSLLNNQLSRKQEGKDTIDRPFSPANEKALETADEAISSADEIEDMVTEQQALAKKIGNHPLLGSLIRGTQSLGKMGEILSALPKSILATLSPATLGDIERFDNLGNTIVTKAIGASKGLPRSNQAQRLIENTKMKLGIDPETNVKIGETLKKHAQDTARKGHHIYERLGRSYDDSRLDHDSQRAAKEAELAERYRIRDQERSLHDGK